MSMGAALKAARALDLAAGVVAVEILCACQAIDLLAPLTTSPLLARAHRRVRDIVPPLTIDRPPAPDIDAIADLDLERRVGVRNRRRSQVRNFSVSN